MRGLLVPRPDDHDFIAIMFTYESIPLFQRKRGLLAFTYRRMAGAELSEP